MKTLLLPFVILGHLLILCKQTTAQLTVQKSGTNTKEVASVPRSFYINSVIDERTGYDSTGRVLLSSDREPVTHKISLQSASLEGITKILTKGSSNNTFLIPIGVRIKEYIVKETLSGNRVLGEATAELLFDIIKDSGPTPLTQYKSTVRYNRPLGNLSIVEPTLQQLLGNSLKFIDSWMAAEASRNPHLARGVALTFRNYQEQHEDTVYYNPMRPLEWDDFREKRFDNKFAAFVFPSFGYDQATKIVDGIIHVDLALKVFVVKSASWVGPGARSNYNLEHEQKHFDLVRLIAERFKQKLLLEKLTPDNFQGIINFEYLEFYREMNRIQRKYDEETSHGILPLVQEFWNRKIEAELKLLDL